MGRSTPAGIISTTRIFQVFRAHRGPALPKPVASKASGLHDLRVFRGLVGNHQDDLVAISGYRTEDGARFFALAHNPTEFSARNRGVSRIFHQLPATANEDNTSLRTALNLDEITSFDTTIASTDANRVLKIDATFPQHPGSVTVLLAGFTEARDGYVRDTLLHGAIFALGGFTNHAKSDWDQKFERAVDALNDAQYAEHLRADQRIELLITAKDLFKELGRPTLAADCLCKIARIILEDPALRRDADLRHQAGQALNSAEKYYQSVNATLALENIGVLRQNR